MSAGASDQFVVFALDDQRYAVSLALVERIVRAVAVTTLPDGPDILLGVIDVRGRVVPVIDLRRKLGLPGRHVVPADHFLIVQANRRLVALVADEANGIVTLPLAAIAQSDAIYPGLKAIRGVARLDDGLVVIHDLLQFLSLEEAAAVDAAHQQEAWRGD